jgi:glycolate oxidase FAD binding subunit
LHHTISAVAQFSDVIREAARAGTPLCLRGGGSKDFYGRNPLGERLDTRSHSGVVAYDPTELVITARCGTPLAEIEAALAEQGQMLAFEPPHFATGGDSGATFGGMIAAGLSGPRRAAAGAVRDFVLGMRLMDGLGRELGFGGRVMKNVAGYDVARLATGSLGTLGLILEASVKTLPCPPREQTVLLGARQEAAIERLNRWAAAGLCISASAWQGDELRLRLSGAEPAVAIAVRAIGGEPLDDGEAALFWRELRDHRHAFFQGETPLWRVSVPQTTSPLELPGEQLIEWGGGLRWLRGTADVETLRAAASRAGGHADLFRGGDRSADIFHPLAPALAVLHRDLRKVFDPHGLFNPGRMYAGI